MRRYDFLGTMEGMDFEHYINRLQFAPISLLVNLSHELTHIMTTYDFLSAKQAILRMFEQTLTWPNSLLAQIMTTHDFLWAKQAMLSNVQLDPLLCLVNLWYELTQIMTTYEFLRCISSGTNYDKIGVLGKWIWALFEASPTLPTWNGFNFTYMEWIDYHALMLIMVLFDQQPQRKLSGWGMEADRLKWLISLNGGAIRPRGLLFIQQNPNTFLSPLHTLLKYQTY